MKVAELLAARRRNWRELELLAEQLESRKRNTMRSPAIARFAALYRAACADLALADAYQLPSDTRAFLHHLVGRAHNQLYRSQSFRIASWGYELLYEVPQRLFRDNALRLCFVLFWGTFIGSMVLSYSSREYTVQTVGQANLDKMENMYEQPVQGRDPDERAAMVGFYIRNNTGLGLQCFAMGLLGGIGGLLILMTNALTLGATFGHMGTSPECRDNFYEFVTAHGPFELTAIVLSAAAGMRLGFALIDTGGLSRRDSLRLAGHQSMPVMGAAMILFFLAALIEAFVSPSTAPYALKALTAALSSGLMLFYFVMLGQPREVVDAA